MSSSGVGRGSPCEYTTGTLAVCTSKDNGSQIDGVSDGSHQVDRGVFKPPNKLPFTADSASVSAFVSSQFASSSPTNSRPQVSRLAIFSLGGEGEVDLELNLLEIASRGLRSPASVIRPSSRSQSAFPGLNVKKGKLPIHPRPPSIFDVTGTVPVVTPDYSGRGPRKLLLRSVSEGNILEKKAQSGIHKIASTYRYSVVASNHLVSPGSDLSPLGMMCRTATPVHLTSPMPFVSQVGVDDTPEVLLNSIMQYVGIDGGALPKVSRTWRNIFNNGLKKMKLQELTNLIDDRISFPPEVYTERTIVSGSLAATTTEKKAIETSLQEFANKVFTVISKERLLSILELLRVSGDEEIDGTARITSDGRIEKYLPMLLEILSDSSENVSIRILGSLYETIGSLVFKYGSTEEREAFSKLTNELETYADKIYIKLRSKWLNDIKDCMNIQEANPLILPLSPKEKKAILKMGLRVLVGKRDVLRSAKELYEFAKHAKIMESRTVESTVFIHPEVPKPLEELAELFRNQLDTNSAKVLSAKRLIIKDIPISGVSNVINKFRNLEYLTISGTGLDSMPSLEIVGANLKCLDLSNNNLINPPKMALCPKMLVMNFAKNPLLKALPPSRLFPELARVDLCSNMLLGRTPLAIPAGDYLNPSGDSILKMVQ